MYRLVLCLIVGLSVINLYGAEPFSFKGSQNASIGVYISEIKTGRCVAQYNSGKNFVPASVQKCVTAATSQMLLGDEPPFTTRAEIKAPIIDGVLEGNLYIVGRGDPTLESRQFKERDGFISSLIEWLTRNGVDSIAGEIVTDSRFYPAIGVSPYWLLEDTAWEYGAGLYGINYRDNSFSMTLRPGDEFVPASNNVEVINLLRHGAKSDVMAMRGEGSGLLTVSGTLSTKSYTSRYSMPSPELFLADDLISELRSSGIGVGGQSGLSDNEDILTFDYASPKRDEILKVTMFKSVNLFAEGMLRALTAKSENRTFEGGIAIEREFWTNKGVDLTNTRWLDGSGLSPVNRMSPRVLASILEYMAKSEISRKYVGLFPLAGKEGTVRYLLAKTRLAGSLALKSGSMNGVLCYAGYKLNSAKTPTHVVVIMVNGASCKSAEIRSAISRYLLSVF